MFNIFKDKKEKKLNDDDQYIKSAALLIHAAKIDENYTVKEKSIIKKTLIELGVKEDRLNEIYNEAATLCKAHHQRLHSIYGKRPKLVTALKQKRWVDKQREKHGMV